MNEVLSRQRTSEAHDCFAVMFLLLLNKFRGVTESEWLVNSERMIEIGWGRDWDASVLLLMPDDLV